MAGAEGSCASRRKGPALPDVPAASPSPSALLSDPRGPDAQTRLPPAAPASQTPLDAAVPVGWPRQNRHEGKGVSGRRGRRPLVPRRARAGRARRAEPRPSSRAMPSARRRGGARGWAGASVASWAGRPSRDGPAFLWAGGCLAYSGHESPLGAPGDVGAALGPLLPSPCSRPRCPPRHSTAASPGWTPTCRQSHRARTTPCVARAAPAAADGKAQPRFNNISLL